MRVPWVIVFEAAALPSFVAKFRRREAPVDVLIVDLGLLGSAPVEAMGRARKRCDATHVVVTYARSPRKTTMRTVPRRRAWSAVHSIRSSC